MQICAVGSRLLNYLTELGSLRAKLARPDQDPEKQKNRRLRLQKLEQCLIPATERSLNSS